MKHTDLINTLENTAQQATDLPLHVRELMMDAVAALAQPAAVPDFSDVIAIQRREAEADPSNAYMVGLYNGMAMMAANYRDDEAWECLNIQPAAVPDETRSTLLILRDSFHTIQANHGVIWDCSEQIALIEELLAATRRDIVRAAAEIGKAMQ